MNLIVKLIKNRVLQHLLFWGISLFLLLKSFQSSSQIGSTDLIYTGIVSLFLVFAVYFNLQLLIPRLFNQGNYLQYAVALAGLLVAIAYVQMTSFDVLVDRIFPGYYLISYFDFWGTFRYYLIFVGVSSLLHFSKSWFLYKEAEVQLALSQKEKVEAELSALKGQINPHFLFNSLNSIYSLVLHKNERAPGVLIKLSDALRYVIYESDLERVALAKEIAFIQNYIDLQQLRLSSVDQVTLNINGEPHQQEIAPLIFLPIIENAFKYGAKSEPQSSKILIEFSIDDYQLHLKVENAVGEFDADGLEISGGSGLKNLKKRLELIYPGKHKLVIEPRHDIFKVKLQIRF